jgi:gamma-glutamyltranspeptidase / glutathione hydrolase
MGEWEIGPKKSHKPKIFFFFSFLFLFSLAHPFLLSPIPLYAATGTRAMVVTADPHATRAAMEVLEEGGNAADAAIVAQWVLNVVEPQSSGIGGGGFFLYYEAETKRIYAFDGREKAPAEAYPEMFLDDEGKPCSFNPDCITGGRPVGVPGVLKLLQLIHHRFGSKTFSFAQLFEPAILLAERGFPISERLSHYIEEEKSRLKLFEASRNIFLDSKGEALAAGTVLYQPDLAKTFRLIQREGTPAFYEGKIAKAILEAVQKTSIYPGAIKKEDLFYYKVVERNPVQGEYRGHDIFSMPPPSSGGPTMIEALQILEAYQLRVHGRSPDGLHLFSEAQKLAFVDRNVYMGDPDFVKMPMDMLLSKKFALERSQEIQFDSAIPTTQAAMRPLHLESPHTSHISIADQYGNMVAFTTTIEAVFGSAMVVPGYGFILNNELTDFDMIPRNVKKELVANAPESEKRPRSSMTPTFVFKKGKPFLVVGSPGGSKIIGAVLNVMVNLIDFGMPLDEALAAPRIINRGGAIEAEPELFNNLYLKRELERRGHPIVESGAIGNVQAIYFDPETEMINGESDPRGEGEALGY